MAKPTGSGNRSAGEVPGAEANRAGGAGGEESGRRSRALPLLLRGGRRWDLGLGGRGRPPRPGAWASESGVGCLRSGGPEESSVVERTWPSVGAASVIASICASTASADWIIASEQSSAGTIAAHLHQRPRRRPPPRAVVPRDGPHLGPQRERRGELARRRRAPRPEAWCRRPPRGPRRPGSRARCCPDAGRARDRRARGHRPATRW